jgi:hypothetical protein
MSKASEILSLEGPLTIKTIVDVKAQLMSSMEKAGARGVPLVVKIDKDADCDLTLPQALLSARKTAQGNGITLTLDVPQEGPFLTVLQRGGFPLDAANQTSLWLNGQ